MGGGKSVSPLLKYEKRINFKQEILIFPLLCQYTAFVCEYLLGRLNITQRKFQIKIQLINTYQDVD